MVYLALILVYMLICGVFVLAACMRSSQMSTEKVGEHKRVVAKYDEELWIGQRKEVAYPMGSE